MAYPLKRHTKVSYNASGFISYQEIEMEKIYYMPDVIDEPNNYWTINGLNKLTGEVVLVLSECPIRTGYRVLITELINSDVSTYHIHVLNTSNDLILDRSVLSSEYGLSSMRFISSAYIMPITIPVKPTGLVATVLNKNSISLTWTDNSDNEASFVIQRSLNGTVWIEVGTVNENITSYIDNGLSPSTSYQYRIVARNAFGNSLPSTKKTATTLPEVPVAPSDLIVEVMSQTVMQLSWTDNAVNEDGYIVQISLNGSTWANIATISTPNVNSYISTGLTSGTKYFYRVYAYNTGGNSEYITESATTLPSIPVAPSGLSATVSGLNITLNWSDNANNEDGYKIERSLYGSKTVQQIATVLSNITTYEDTDLPSGTEYEYRVRAYNIAGNSEYSNTIQVTTMNAPDAPLEFVGFADNQNGYIEFMWSDVADETGYIMERSDNNGSTWTQLSAIATNEYKDYTAAPGVSYCYRIYAYNEVGSGGYSDILVLNLAGAPTAPNNLIATASSSTQINLTWTPNSQDENGFELQISLDQSTWNTIYTAQAGEISYSNTGLNSTTTYYYRVFAYNDIGNSDYSNIAIATTPESIPVAPSNLNATASGLNVLLTWTDNSNNETGFKLERSIHNTKVWTEIATLAANTTSHGDTGLEAGTSYDYRVRAYNTAGNSDYSLTATATTLAIPSKPYLLSVNVSSSTELTLSWTDGSTNESSFKIERSLNGVSSWTQIATVSANVITYSDTGLTSQTKYYYRARAYNAAGNSDYSNIANGTTLQSPPATPLDFDIVVISTSSVKLTWTVVSADQTAFVIDKSTNGGLTWTSTVINTPGLETYTATGLNYNTTYSFRVFARNLGGDSEPTKTIDIKVIL